MPEPLSSEGREFIPPVTNAEKEAHTQEQRPGVEPVVEQTRTDQAAEEMANEVSAQHAPEPETASVPSESGQISTLADLNSILAEVTTIGETDPKKSTPEDYPSAQEYIVAAHELRQKNKPN